MIGKFVISLPAPLQEPAFMMIQYLYALLTMLPCPLWFWSRWASALFLCSVFSWSIWNGATYYIDVFGKRFENELEQMKRDVAKWQNSPDAMSASPNMGALTPGLEARKNFDLIPPLEEEKDVDSTRSELGISGSITARQSG